MASLRIVSHAFECTISLPWQDVLLSTRTTASKRYFILQLAFWRQIASTILSEPKSFRTSWHLQVLTYLQRFALHGYAKIGS